MFAIIISKRPKFIIENNKMQPLLIYNENIIKLRKRKDASFLKGGEKMQV